MEMRMDDSMIAPNDIVKKFNISYQTLNNYTNIGLLVVRHKKGNVRLYESEEVRQRLDNINKLKNKGYTLRLIRGML
jgi:DNA-binding transcriptional MerR regulator